MSLERCNICEKEFLTESDSYVLESTPEGHKLNCGCYFGDGFWGRACSRQQEKIKQLKEDLKEARFIKYENERTSDAIYNLKCALKVLIED